MIVPNASFQELLSVAETDPSALSHWISRNLEKETALDELLASIGQNPKYFHLYVEYADQSLRKWNALPKKLVAVLGYLFRNLTNLSKENVNVTRMIDGYEFSSIFASPDVLDSVTAIPVDEIDASALVRFVRYFIQEFDRNLNLSEKKGFFRNVVVHLSKNRPEAMHEIFGSRPERLFEECGFCLSEGYSAYFEITKSEGKKAYAFDREVAHLRRMPEAEVLAEMERMDEKTFRGFVDRLGGTGNSAMHFLGFRDVSKLSDTKLFYLSLAYKSKLFPTQKTSSFMAFCLEEMEKDVGRVFGENLFSDLNWMLEFFAKEKIPLLENVELFGRVAEAVSKNERYAFEFERFLISADTRTITWAAGAEAAYGKVRGLSEKTSAPCFYYLARQLLSYGALPDYLEFVESNRMPSGEWSRLAWRCGELLVSASHPANRNVSRSGYRTQERFLKHALSVELLSKYEKRDVVKNFSEGNGKSRYVLMRNKRLWDPLFTSKYERNDIREKCFSSTVFPIGMAHALMRLFSKN